MTNETETKRTSADARVDLETAKASVIDANCMYLAGTAEFSVYRAAEAEVLRLTREIENLERLEAVHAAEVAQAAAVKAEAERAAEEVASRAFTEAPLRKRLAELLEKFATSSPMAREDLKAIVAGEIAKARIRARSEQQFTLHGSITVLRNRLGESASGDYPPTVDILLRVFVSAVDVVLGADSWSQIRGSGIPGPTLREAAELVAECGGPDHRLRAPTAEEVAQLGAALGRVLDLEAEAEPLRVAMLGFDLRDPRRESASDRLRNAVRGAEAARQEAAALAAALEEDHVDVRLVAPVRAPRPVAPEAAEPPSPTRLQTFKERFLDRLGGGGGSAA